MAPYEILQLMRTETISYKDGDCDLEAFVAYPSEVKPPLVLLCHAWKGRDEFICKKAQDIAQLGYVGFALDMYGKGVLGQSKEENAALKRPFLENRELLQKRVLKAFNVACNLPDIDASRIAVLGYGFGGICALDLAGEVDLKGAISVYGHFDQVKPIRSKVLILHGYQDTVTPLEELTRFEKEMTGDWQVHIYGNAMHAFATPEANDPKAGILYNPDAAKRSWIAIVDFLAEIVLKGN